jgi:class 3 adenylate cyclase/CHASE2 domain-containing sensor protein
LRCPGFFVLFGSVKPKQIKRVPGLIAFGVIAFVCLMRWLQVDFFERLERMTYDMRVREAAKHSPSIATNLGFVAIDDRSATFVRLDKTNYGFGLYWPRKVYGRLVEELAAQGAKAIAFDVIFAEERPDLPAPVQLRDGRVLKSDEFLAEQMRQAGNVIIAWPAELNPTRLFLTNAMAGGDISTDRDQPEGVLRRAHVFRRHRVWHPAFEALEEDRDLAVNLERAEVEPGRIIVPAPGADPPVIKIPLNKNGEFDEADFWGGATRFAKPYTDEVVWQMGIVLAAQVLNLDLKRAEIDVSHGRVILRGPGVERVIPVYDKDYFYIDWCIPLEHKQLTQENLQFVLKQAQRRLDGETTGLTNLFNGKLVVVGSRATGNDLTDRGSTPLEADTLLFSEHWNIANSVITDRFIRRAPLGIALALILAVGGIAAVATWELRARTLLASGLVALLLVLYSVAGTMLYTHSRYWIPLVLPMFGALAVHLCLVTYRVVFEQAEQRRVKSVFSKMVSPKIVHELLGKETLSLGGARREITVFFADVRGFTELTDKTQKRVDAYVKANNLTGAAAEAYIDAQARETLNTVNTYLGVIADVIKKHDGTLDKFIGDCVMAFWGAPTPNPKHALTCVRSAIEAQRAMAAMNVRRAEENKKREAENTVRVASGLEPHQPLPLLTLGTGINTGMATAGLMGSSEAESLSYTVFGREINLASRLEGASGRGRIFIGESTYSHIKRDDPELAATCVMQPPLHVKGFEYDVLVYEVPWRTPDMPPAEPQPAKPVAVAPVPVPSQTPA